MVFQTWTESWLFMRKIWISNWKCEISKENVKFSKCFLFSVNFPIFSNLQEPEKCDFCVFHQKVRFSLKWLKYWNFQEKCGNLVKSATFPPMSKIPSITKRFYRYFRYFSRKYLKFSDFLRISLNSLKFSGIPKKLNLRWIFTKKSPRIIDFHCATATFSDLGEKVGKSDLFAFLRF